MSSNSVTEGDDSHPGTVAKVEMVFFDSHTENTTIKEEEETRQSYCIICYELIQNSSSTKIFPVEILCKSLKIPTTIISNQTVLEALGNLYCSECLDKVEEAARILKEIKCLEKLVTELGSFFKNKITTTFKQSETGDCDPINEVRKSFVQCWKGWTVPISLSELPMAPKLNKKNKKIVNELTSTNEEIDSTFPISVEPVPFEPDFHDDHDDPVSENENPQENKSPAPVTSLRPRRSVKRKSWKYPSSESEEPEESENNIGLKKRKRVKKSDQNSKDKDDDWQEELEVQEKEKRVGRPTRPKRSERSRDLKPNVDELNSESRTKTRYSCAHCQRTFSSLIARDGHIKQKHEGDSRPYECDECSRKFEKPSRLVAHKKRWHSIQPKSESENKEKSSNPVGGCAFPCPDCRLIFKSEQSKQVHILKVHKGMKRPHKCSVCDKNFRYKVHLDTHMELHEHNSSQFPCTECEKEFVSERNLRVHMAKVHFPGDKPFKCDSCTKTFRTVYLLENHMAKHTGVKKKLMFICELCGHNYSNKRGLELHLQRHASGHESKEPFQCDQCDKVFNESHSLNSHIMSIHEKKFRFHCEICGQGCQNLSMLNRHKLCHTDEKMFSCDICVNKKFKRKPQLIQHMLIHENKFPYVCRHCSKGFRASEKLKNHERLHTGEKPFSCHVLGCDKTFALRHYLTHHINVSHKGMKQKKRSMNTEGPRKKAHSTRRVKQVLNSDVAASEVVFTIDGQEITVYQMKNEESLQTTDLPQEQESAETEIEIAVNSLTASASNNGDILITRDTSYDPSYPNSEWVQYGFINAPDSGKDSRQTVES